MKFSQESLSPGAEKKEKILKEKMSKEAVLVQKEGVAHIGPDFKNVSHEMLDTSEEQFVEDLKDKNSDEEDIKTRHKTRVEKFFGKNLVNATSKFRYLISKKATGLENTKELKIGAGMSKRENLKTMPESKKERNSRGKIKEVLSDPKNWEESNEKLNPEDLISE
jgi:hypothetical protein